MREILIVTEANNSLLMSVKKHLLALSYKTYELPAEVNALHDFKYPIRGILIDANKRLIEKRRLLYLLRARALHDDIPIFAVCSAEELQVIRTIIPINCICIIHRENTAQIMEDATDTAEEIDRLIDLFSVKKKILVVDDSGPMLRGVKSWLENKYVVYLANSGTTAIKYLALQRPDLILLDYEMPVCDGRQVLEMIRADPEVADIPVIFLTRKGDVESVMSVRHLEPKRYLLKTMEPSQIVKAVDDFFEEKRIAAYKKALSQSSFYEQTSKGNNNGRD